MVMNSYVCTMVIDLILVPSKPVDIPKNTDLWRNFYYATLLNSYFFMGDLLQIFSEQHLWKAASGHLHYNKKQGKQRYIDQCICFICFISLKVAMK